MVIYASDIPRAWASISLLSAFVFVSIFIGITLYFYYKHKDKKPNDLDKLGPVYEQVDNLKPDPHTEGNLAYGHVQHTGRQQSSQPPTELREQVYEEPENFKPDPHTQGNVAYGQVQFTQELWLPLQSNIFRCVFLWCCSF